MSPLEAAQAEVDRLKLEAETIPFTTKWRENTQKDLLMLANAVSTLNGLLGLERDETAGRGWGETTLKTITAIQSRLDALDGRMDTFERKATGRQGRSNHRHQNAYEALAERLDALEALVISVDVDRLQAVLNDAPETVATGEAIDPNTIGKDGKPITLDPNVGYLLREDRAKQNKLRQHEYGQDILDAQAAQSVRDGLKAGLGVDDLVAKVNAEWKSETTILDRASIVFTKDGREAILVEDFQRLTNNAAEKNAEAILQLEKRLLEQRAKTHKLLFQMAEAKATKTPDDALFAGWERAIKALRGVKS